MDILLKVFNEHKKSKERLNKGEPRPFDIITRRDKYRFFHVRTQIKTRRGKKHFQKYFFYGRKVSQLDALQAALKYSRHLIHRLTQIRNITSKYPLAKKKFNEIFFKDDGSITGWFIHCRKDSNYHSLTASHCVNYKYTRKQTTLRPGNEKQNRAAFEYLFLYFCRWKGIDPESKRAQKIKPKIWLQVRDKINAHKCK